MLPDSCQYLSCSLQLHGEDVCLKCILIIWYFYYWLKAKHDVFTGLLYSYFYKFECLVTQNIAGPFQCVQLLLWICWNFVYVSRFMQVTYWFSLILALNISGYLLYARNSMNYSSIVSHLKVFWRWLNASSVLYFIPSFPFLPCVLNSLSLDYCRNCWQNYLGS